MEKKAPKAWSQQLNQGSEPWLREELFCWRRRGFGAHNTLLPGTYWESRPRLCPGCMVRAQKRRETRGKSQNNKFSQDIRGCFFLQGQPKSGTAHGRLPRLEIAQGNLVWPSSWPRVGCWSTALLRSLPIKICNRTNSAMFCIQKPDHCRWGSPPEAHCLSPSA